MRLLPTLILAVFALCACGPFGDPTMTDTTPAAVTPPDAEHAAVPATEPAGPQMAATPAAPTEAIGRTMTAEIPAAVLARQLAQARALNERYEARLADQDVALTALLAKQEAHDRELSEAAQKTAHVVAGIHAEYAKRPLRVAEVPSPLEAGDAPLAVAEVPDDGPPGPRSPHRGG